MYNILIKSRKTKINNLQIKNMKKIILTTVFLIALVGQTFSQREYNDITLLFGPLHKNIAFEYFGRNEVLFWEKLKAINSIEERKRMMTSYTLDITNSFLKEYQKFIDEGYDVSIEAFVNKDLQVNTTIDKIINLREAASKRDWDAMEKAANQLGFGYDTYLYY
jgi:hypothetical protein